MVKTDNCEFIQRYKEVKAGSEKKKIKKCRKGKTVENEVSRRVRNDFVQVSREAE